MDNEKRRKLVKKCKSIILKGIYETPVDFNLDVMRSALEHLIDCVEYDQPFVFDFDTQEDQEDES